MMQKFLSAILFILILPLTLLAAKPPSLTPHDTKTKIQEILKAHVSHQAINSEILTRALLNFIEELDPAKTYFLESEITAFLHPSEEFLNQALAQYEKGDFSCFSAIYKEMLQAVTRRNLLENDLKDAALNVSVQASSFKDLPWATTTDELKDRLNQIRSLQLKTAEKLESTNNQTQFLQRLTKRRLSRESDLVGTSKQEQEQIVLSFALKAMSSALDSQTIYFTPTEANQFMIQVQQRLFGIGAQLRDDLNGFTITKIVEGSPAFHSNQLKMGDKIIAVDNEPVVGMDITDAVSLIRGPQGSSLQLTVLRESKEGDFLKEEKLLVDLVRGEIVLQESRLESFYEPYADGIIAILHLHSFYQDNNTSSTADLEKAFRELQKEHLIKGVILDLRDNGGGLLPQAVSVSGLFLSKGVVVSVKDNTGQIQHLRNLDNRKMWDGPLLVLTSRTSASAAEIVAQTLQDYGRALVVGDPETFGKGTFQTFTLESSNFGKVNPKGEYKVTRGRYYTVSGKSPQLIGVKADIPIPGPFSQMEIGEKYSKFPVATDEIASHFNDTFLDIPPLHRPQLEKLYRWGKQPVLTTYRPYLETLQKNAASRISKNTLYQSLLKESSKDADSLDSFELFQKHDVQMTEAKNVMKDLLYLIEKQAQVTTGSKAA